MQCLQPQLHQEPLKLVAIYPYHITLDSHSEISIWVGEIPPLVPRSPMNQIPWTNPWNLTQSHEQCHEKHHSKSHEQTHSKCHEIPFEIWKAPFFLRNLESTIFSCDICSAFFVPSSRKPRQVKRSHPASAMRGQEVKNGDPKWWRFHHYMNDIIGWLIWLLYRCYE